MSPAEGVRSARSEDVASIQRIAREAWTHTYADIMPPTVRDQALASWYAREALHAQLDDPAGTFLVAQDGTGALVGFAQFVSRDEVTGELTRIYVLPGHQGMGFGTHLLAAGLNWLQGRRLATLTVAVEEDNPMGRRFYERSGFTELCRKTQDIFGHSLSLVLYERPVV